MLYSSTPAPRPAHDVRLDHTDHDRRREFALINSLIFSLDRYITSAKDRHSDNAVVDYLRLKLSQPNFYNPSRPLAYDKIVLLLLQNRRFDAACTIYDVMSSEGILPSPQVRAKLSGISIACSADSEDSLLQALKPLFSQEIYDEHSLRELLDLLSLKISPELIDRIFDLYVASRGDGYVPSSGLTSDVLDILIRGGLVNSAKDLLDTAHRHDGAEAAYPYVAMLKALKSFRNPDPAAIRNVLLRMQQDDVVPDVAVLNSLIATEVWMKNYHNAFNLYNIIKASPEELELSPDAFTFSSLFTAFERLDSNTRKWRRLADTVTPRKLYCEMLTYHFIDTGGTPGLPSSVLTPSVLAVALRTFMVRRDYPAAFVVLRSHGVNRLQPTLDTYLAVFKSLAIQIRLDLKTAKSGPLPTLVGDIRNVMDSPNAVLTNALIFERLLALGHDQRVVQQASTGEPQEEVATPSKDASRQSSRPKSYRTPTVAMLTGEEVVSPLATFHITPLQRILRHAITVDLERFVSQPQSVSTCAVRLDSEERRARPTLRPTSHVVIEAKRAMLPEMTSELYVKLRKSRKRKTIDRRNIWSKSNKFLWRTRTYSLYVYPFLPGVY